MPDDKPFEENTENGLEGQQSSDDGEEREAEEQLSRHAFHSTWEEIYQRELHNATARKAYQTTNQHKRTSIKRQADCRGSSRSSSSSRSSCGSNSDSSSDRCSIDGEEWFGPECGKILNWVLSTLSRRQNHPLQLYFRRVHAVSSPDSSGAAECRGGACDWCRGEGPLISQDFTKIPVLDVGCGGGQFLVRLRRCGFERLAGIDYSHSAIQLARSNVCEKSARTSRCTSSHICLRQADLRHLRACETVGDLKQGEIVRPCICCCRKAQSEPSIPLKSETERRRNDGGNSSPCSCEPATRLPPFPVVFDKGTFDVFWLMRTPELYVQCMHRLMPQYGLLFLTSCNCTLEDLESLFCAKTETTQQQQHQQQQDKQKVSPIRPHGENKMHADATHHAVTASAASSGAPDPDGLARNSNLGEEGNTPTPKMPLFERIGILPHRSFKFGGVEGQVVTSVLLRRL